MTDVAAAPSRGPGRPAVGRAEPLTLPEILERAMQIVREQGKEALSMRRLAADLGVTPMALYHHIKDKPALIDALIAQVWAKIGRDLSWPRNPIEYIVAFSVHTRQVWLDNFELANLAVAVADPEDWFFRWTKASTVLFEAAGFPDVPLAYSAVQTFTMGAVEVAASRRVASAYFGRDPDVMLAQATELLEARDATPNHLGVVEARFDAGEDRHFEPALRAMLAGLLAGPS